MRLRILLFFVPFLIGGIATAQPPSDQLLATQYYNDKEFEKAVVLFEKLHRQNPSSNTIYQYHLDCLLQLKGYADAEKLVKKQMKKAPTNLTYQVDLGRVALAMGDAKKAEKQFGDAVAALTADRATISQLAAAFMNMRNYEFAAATYEKGSKLLRDYSFSYERAMLAREMGDLSTMSAHLLDYLTAEPNQSDRVRTVLQDEMDDDAFVRTLTTQLYQRIQVNPDDIIFTETLTWLLLQQKDFAGALRQVKALDRRLRDQGKRVHELATTLMTEREYDVAAEAFQYLIDQGRNTPFYFYGREGLLRARKAKITASYGYTTEDLNNLKADYLKFIEEYGFNKTQAAPTLRELAQLEAFYLHNTARAIEILEDLVKSPGLTPRFVAECKLDLGDCYLIGSDDPWGASLLYSQVDKDMKDDPLGEEARYRNARWWYFQGDFLWAQSQLDVLKASTSELIANDALNLSVFITDHLGLDSTSVPMEMFARAELLAFQNRHPEAFAALDSLETRYPDHSLQDDIYMLKGRIRLKEQRIEDAIAFLDKIITGHQESILVDDALFKLGDLYQYALRDYEKAMAYYERILLEQKGSIFVVDARNRFRALRGDKLN
jgi:tetratricopeptide (TPR) repeat protein